MRTWPPLQILAILLFIGGGLFSLSLVIDEEQTPLDLTSLPTPGPMNGPSPGLGATYIEISGTAPFLLTRLTQGKIEIEVAERSDTAFSSKLERWNDEAIQIQASIDPQRLPVALKIEIEDPIRGTAEVVRWIRRPEITLILYRSDFYE